MTRERNALEEALGYLESPEGWAQTGISGMRDILNRGLAGAPLPEPQGEPAVALPLDPEPWLFISDQVFGELRSGRDKGFHSVSGTYWAFSPRREYEQDRARYESVGGVR